VDETIVKLMKLLDILVEERGVPKQKGIRDKNIIASSNSPNDNDGEKKKGLTAENKSTLVDVFSLFNKMFFDYQKKVSPDTKLKTLSGDIASKQKRAESPPQDRGGCNYLSMILAGLGLLAVSIGGIVGSLMGFFGDLGGSVVKAVSKLGFLGALKIMSTTLLKKLSLKVLKRLPVIGGIIGLGYAAKAFIDGDIFLGVAELVSALLNFIPGIGPFLSLGADILIAWAQSKGVFDEGGALSPENGWNTIKGWVADIGQVIKDNALYIPIVGSFMRFGMAAEAFKSGKTGEGLKQIALGLLTFTPFGGLLIKGVEVLSGFLNSDKSPEPIINDDSSWGDRIIGWIRSKLKDLPWWIKKPLAWFGIISDDQVGEPAGGAMDALAGGAAKGFEKTKEFFKGVWDSMKGPVGGAMYSIGEFAENTWEKTKEYTGIAWDKAKEAGTWFKDSMTSMADKAKEKLAEWIPAIVSTITGVADSAMNVLKNLASTIGGWIGGLFTFDDEKKMKEATKAAEVKKEQLVRNETEISSILTKSSESSARWSKILCDIGIEQQKLLLSLVNIGNQSVKELRRISGNNSGGPIIVNQPSPVSTPRDSVELGNNRSGYTSSPYSLA